jgi:hypothetical protein
LPRLYDQTLLAEQCHELLEVIPSVEVEQGERVTFLTLRLLKLRLCITYLQQSELFGFQARKLNLMD